MILIEGADMVGKTTLARRLVRELHERSVPAIYRAFGLLPKAWDYYRDYLPHIQRPVVMDRFHLSEIAYAVAARGGQTGLDRERFALIEAHLTLVGCVRVLVTANEEALRANYPSHFEREAFDVDTIVRADQAFRAANGLRARPGEDSWADVRFEITRNSPKAMPAENDVLVDSILGTWLARQRLLDCTVYAREGRVWT